MRVFDCFTFFDEVELLDLRMAVLADVVDVHVLIESRQTFTGHYKPLWYTGGLDKVQHVVTRDVALDDPWIREAYQRNGIMQGLRDAGAEPDDLILIGDVDEIPSPESVGMFRGSGLSTTTVQRLYYYWANLLQEQRIKATVLTTFAKMSSPEGMRQARFDLPFVGSGWHFSFLGGVDRIQRKLAAYSETQTNKPEFSGAEHLKRCLETGADHLRRTEARFQKRWVSISDETHPPGMAAWLEKYPYMVKQR